MTMGFDDDGDPPPMGQTDRAADHADVEMDVEETTAAVVGTSMEKSGRSSLQNEAARSTRKTTAATTTTGMQKIDEGNEEEDEILGMKTRNWKKINLSFTVELNGQDGDDI